jgi:hypothetical protein
VSTKTSKSSLNWHTSGFDLWTATKKLNKNPRGIYRFYSETPGKDQKG